MSGTLSTPCTFIGLESFRPAGFLHKLPMLISPQDSSNGVEIVKLVGDLTQPTLPYEPNGYT